MFFVRGSVMGSRIFNIYGGNFKMKKRIVSAIIAVCMLATLVTGLPMTSYAENEVTRGEWISNLVETFSMAVEEDVVLPDNYFGDITPDMECFDDILLW